MSTPRIRSQVQSGKVYVEPVANVPTMVHVTFEQPFLDIPQVVVSPNTTVPGTTVLEVGAANITKEGFDAYVTRTNTTTTSVSFIAALTNDFELNMSMQTDAWNNPGTTKILKHYGNINQDNIPQSSQFVDVELEWTLRDTKGAMIRSGFTAFAASDASNYKTPQISTDFTGLAVGDYRLTHESHVPGFGVFKTHAIIRLNADGTIKGDYLEPYQVD